MKIESTTSKSTGTTVSPELDAAILLLIAQHVKRPLPSAYGNHPLVEKAVNIDRETLVNLMKTSKVSEQLLKSWDLMLMTRLYTIL